MIAKPWSPDEDNQLRELRAEGWSLGAIGERLGRTRCSCIGRNDRLKTVQEGAQRNETVIDARVAQGMADCGGTVAITAARLGMSHQQTRTSWRRIKAQMGWQAK